MKPVVPILLLLLVLPVNAATRTWTGVTNGQWTVASNWSGGIAPVAGDGLFFGSGGVANLSNTNDFPAGTAFSAITVTVNGYTLAGNAINLGGGGILATHTGSCTISIPFTLTAAQVWQSILSGALTVSSDVNVNGNLLGLAAEVGSSCLLSGAVSGSGTIQKVGANDWMLSGNNTFSGQVQVSAGSLIVNSVNALGVADNTPANGTIVNSGGSLILGAFTYPAEDIRIFGSGSGGSSSVPAARSRRRSRKRVAGSARHSAPLERSPSTAAASAPCTASPAISRSRRPRRSTRS